MAPLAYLRHGLEREAVPRDRLERLVDEPLLLGRHLHLAHHSPELVALQLTRKREDEDEDEDEERGQERTMEKDEEG